MDGKRFDDLTRRLGNPASRRQMLRAVIGGAAGALGGALVGRPGATAAPPNCASGVRCGKECCALGASCIGSGRNRRCACPDGQAVCADTNTCVSTVCTRAGEVYDPFYCECVCPCAAECCPAGGSCSGGPISSGGTICICNGPGGIVGSCSSCTPSGSPPPAGTACTSERVGACCSGRCVDGNCCSDDGDLCQTTSDCCYGGQSVGGEARLCVNGVCTRVVL